MKGDFIGIDNCCLAAVLVLYHRNAISVLKFVDGNTEGR